MNIYTNLNNSHKKMLQKFLPTPFLSSFMLALVLALFLNACESQQTISGYTPPEGLVNTLQVGKTDRASAIRLLGEPVDIAPLGSSDVYYLSQLHTLAGPLPEIELDRNLIVLRFDEGGILRKIDRMNDQDGRSVSYESDITETPGVYRPNFFVDFFGNIGRFVKE